MKLIRVILILLAITLTSQAKTDEKTLSNVYDLLEVMHVRDNFNKIMKMTIDNQMRMLPAQIKKDPVKYKKFKEITENFFNKYFSWDELRDDIAKVYANNFTSEDIENIKKFYTTPTGQKALEKMPNIAKETMQLTNKKIMPHMQEYYDEIKKAFKKK